MCVATLGSGLIGFGLKGGSMNSITKTLLGGAALCALATAPATAEDTSAFPVTAVHAGHVVNKTRVHTPGRTHLTYTFGVYTYVLFAEAYRKKIQFAGYKYCPAR